MKTKENARAIDVTNQDDSGASEHLSVIEKQQLAIAARRQRVASLLSQSRTESEIAQELGVNQSTISRDIQTLKEDSGKFLEDLAKSDLVFSYQQSIRGIDEVKRRLWDKVNSDTTDFSPRDKLVAFRLIMIAEETKFRLLQKGPLLFTYESLDNRLKRLEGEDNLEAQGDDKPGEQ